MSGLLTATHMGSIEEDLDWSGTLLGGLTIMPYVSHSVSRGQPCVLCQACPWAKRTRTAGCPVSLSLCVWCCRQGLQVGHGEKVSGGREWGMRDEGWACGCDVVVGMALCS